MRNLLVEIRYNGARYHGYQVQENALSVMETVQDAVERALKRREPVTGCSRTDAGVHANQYFFHMKTEASVPPERFIRAMNNTLPPDIAVLSCREVPPGFHARYSCLEKEYVYQIWNAPVKNPFLSDFAMHHPRPIREAEVQEAAGVLVGTHDFTSFCSAGGKEGSRVRTVKSIAWEREGNLVRMKISADGFLYNMVRIIAGTLVEWNDGRLRAGSLAGILAAKDRSRAGKTAPPQGLFLNRVDYGPALQTGSEQK